jgi:hypothetical protein
LAYPSYAEIADRLGIPRCRGLTASGHQCRDYNHRQGVVGDGLVHWADRKRVERAGIRRFLRLAANRDLIEQGVAEPWKRLYWSQAMINRWGMTLGVRFPASLTEHDKIELKAMLVNEPQSPLRKEAMDWVLYG